MRLHERYDLSHRRRRYADGLTFTSIRVEFGMYIPKEWAGQDSNLRQHPHERGDGQGHRLAGPLCPGCQLRRLQEEARAAQRLGERGASSRALERNKLVRESTAARERRPSDMSIIRFVPLANRIEFPTGTGAAVVSQSDAPSLLANGEKAAYWRVCLSVSKTAGRRFCSPTGLRCTLRELIVGTLMGP